jgi:hypothetical protein
MTTQTNKCYALVQIIEFNYLIKGDLYSIRETDFKNDREAGSRIKKDFTEICVARIMIALTVILLTIVSLSETYKSILSIILYKYISLDWRHLLLLIGGPLVEMCIIALSTRIIIAARFLVYVI